MNSLHIELHSTDVYRRGGVHESGPPFCWQITLCYLDEPFHCQITLFTVFIEIFILVGRGTPPPLDKWRPLFFISGLTSSSESLHSIGKYWGS